MQALIFIGEVLSYDPSSRILKLEIRIAGPVTHCQHLALSLGWCFALAMPFNSFLFFFRVRAVFRDSPLIVTCFAILWVSTFATISAPFAIDNSISIGSPPICLETDVKGFSNAGPVIIAVHDTVVYFAISFRLSMNSLARGRASSNKFMDVIKIFFSGKGVGQISKSLMTTGQLYYL